MTIPESAKRILGVNDLRGTLFADGVPIELYGKGLVVGFCDAGSLSIPGLAPTEIGNLAVSAMATGVDQLDCMFREFTHPTAKYIQHADAEAKWGKWETHSWDHTGFAKLHEEQEFTKPQIFGKAVVETTVQIDETNVIDVSLGSIFTKTISTATTFTLVGADDFQHSADSVVSFALRLNDGGLEKVTWWPGVKWPGGNEPPLTPSGTDLLGFVSIDAGATWMGVVLGQNYK